MASIINEYNESVDLDSIQDRSNLSVESLVRDYKLRTIAGFLHNKRDRPDLNIKQLAKLTHTSVSSLSRIRKDLGVQSFYKYNVPRNKTITHSSNIVQVKADNVNKCDVCSKECKSKSGLKSHLKSHREVKGGHVSPVVISDKKDSSFKETTDEIIDQIVGRI